MGAVIIPQNLPVGYRFHPTDEELVDHYLKNRVLGYIDCPCVFPDVDICRWDPWELPQKFHGESIIPLDDKVQEWGFFCLQTPKQVKRLTPSGYWKKTGTDRNVKARDANRVIGTKKTLVFHIGRGSKGINTKWVVHEYHLLANDAHRNYVLCWLKHTRDEKADKLVHGAINLADLDLDLCHPDHEDSLPEPLIQASEEVTIETENQNEMSISSMPDSNVPIIPQQAQMHEEQSSLSNDYLSIDRRSDECYAVPYSPSDGIEIMDLWNVG